MPFAPSPLTMTSAVFVMTYLALALGRVPGLQVDRPGIALIGAAMMLAAGLLDLPAAAAAIDMETIALLFGMMALVAYLQIAGFFQWAASALARREPGPHGLLAITISLSGILSAFLVNDVVCVALTPLVLNLCRRRGRHAMPYLIGLATASNIGSVATITGNPQNMMIGTLSGISYRDFATRLVPVALVGLALNYLVVAWVYRRMLSEPDAHPATANPLEMESAGIHRGLLAKGLAVTSAVIVLFFAGYPVATVALVAAAVMMLGQVRPHEVYQRIDWSLLVMFMGLFVVVHGFDSQVVRTWGLDQWDVVTRSPVIAISLLSVVLSNLVSNVPAVLLFKPVVSATSDPDQAWLALAMSSTLAGNLTVLGSVANLIVVETARRLGTHIGFAEYLKAGIPVTILTVAFGMAWLLLTGS